MHLSELIERLDRLDHATVFPHGFYRPHSYRGDYSQLAFVPRSDVSVADMLASAREANGKTYTGWKGGEFTMGDYTDVYLAQVGECGEQLTAQFFDQLELIRLRAENAKLAAEVERLKLSDEECGWRKDYEREKARADAAEKERDEANAALVNIREMHFENGALDVAFSGDGATAIAMVLVAFYKEHGGENYVEMQLADKTTGERYTVTIQRVAGKTPHELRDAAEASRDRLAAALREIAEDDPDDGCRQGHATLAAAALKGESR